jgi:hypothetical protein
MMQKHSKKGFKFFSRAIVIFANLLALLDPTLLVLREVPVYCAKKQ